MEHLDGQDGGNNYYRGIGWYRVHCAVDGSYTNRHFFLKFDGAFLVADVYVNGNYLGEHQGGFAAFVFDVTPYLNVGGDNVIAVKVNNAFNANIPPLSADFTFFGGIYRDVHLLVTDPVQISPLDYGSPGVFLKTTSVSFRFRQSSSDDGCFQCHCDGANGDGAGRCHRCGDEYCDDLDECGDTSAASISNVVASTVIASPHLWNGLSDPYLYQAFIEIHNGTNVADVVSQPLGFRWFSVDPTNGFFPERAAL